MKLQIAEEIRSAFSDVEPPVFEKFLDGIRYVDPDQEPVEFLTEIYPCSDLRRIDRYKLEEILFSLTPEAYLYVVPRVLIYLLENESGMDENLPESFMPVIDVVPDDPNSQMYSLREKSKKFYSQLTAPQRDIMIMAYQVLSRRPNTDRSEELIFQRALDHLGKMNKNMT